jgi:hypothetical protein
MSSTIDVDDDDDDDDDDDSLVVPSSGADTADDPMPMVLLPMPFLEFTNVPAPAGCDMDRSSFIIRATAPSLRR